MKRIGIYAACLALTLALAAPGYAQQPTPREGGKAASQGKMDRADAKFIEKAFKDNKMEVELGQLAAERGSSEQVKKFGERMVKDHTKANEELMQIAQQKGVKLPEDTKHSKEYGRLSKLSGAKFDEEYMKLMVKDHDKDVTEFQREAQRAKDPDVKSWAAKTLPVIQEHDAQARQLQASLKGASNDASASPSTKKPSGSGSPKY